MSADSRRRYLARILALCAALILVAAAGMVGVVALNSPTAHAANASSFTPGYIISDANFYNSDAMTASEVQSFLNSKVPQCHPEWDSNPSDITCLKDYHQQTTAKRADSYCKGYSSQWQSAAQIIDGVARSCGISQKVLLVTLQKESTLVTHSWPSSWRYTEAMGYACPDTGKNHTANCDANYSGFFNQVYSAARQFKLYQASPSEYRYRAGQKNFIQWSPTESCGGSDVYIQNQSTAALYNYTPYQPNAAALAAGYGSGDSCSSYGNRNFYLYYSDWFGDSTFSSPLVKSSGSSVVYLVSGNTKYPVKDWASYQLLSRLGSLQTVSDSYLASLPTGATAGNILRDSQTGTIYQITSVGQKNSFPSCSLLHSFTNLTCDASQMPNLTTSALNEFSTGSEISSFIKTTESPTVYYFTGTQLRAVTSWNDAISLNSGTPPTPYLGTQEDLTRLTISSPIYAPGTLVKTKTSSQVYVVDGWDSLIPLGSFQVSTALGFGSTVTTLQTTTLPAGYTATTSQLSPQVSQGGTTYLGLDGTLHKLTNPKTTGLATTPISAATAKRLTTTGTISSTKVFLKTQNSVTVYLLSNGTLNPLGTWATAIAENNGTTPTITTVTQQTLSAFTTGTTLFAPGTAVVSTGNPAVYLIDSATTKIYVTSLETLTDLDIQLVRTTDTAALNTYTQTTSPLTNIVTCNSTTYIAGSGTLWRLSQPTTTLGALTTTPLSAQTCATLHTNTQPQQHVFLKTPNSPDVYYLTNGKKQRISTWAQAITTNNNTPPTPITLQPHDLTTIPTRQ